MVVCHLDTAMAARMVDRQMPKSKDNYRWIIVAAAAISSAVALGQIVNGLSAFFIPLEQEFGWSRGSIAMINTIGLIGIALGGIVLGGLADRIGIRTITSLGALALGLCLIAASRADQLWQLYVLFFIAGAIGGGAFGAPIMALVGNWFKAGAGLAIGIVSGGQAVGQGGIPFAAAVLIGSYGWRMTFLIFGFVTLAVLLLTSQILRDPPAADSTKHAELSGQLPTPFPNSVILLWLSAAVVFCCTCMAVPLMHLVPLIQGRGISSPEASSVLFLMLMVAIAGRVAFGKLADMIGAIPAYFTASLWQTALVFGFTFFSNLHGFYVYAVVYGFGYAGVMTTVLVSTRELTPINKRGISMGVVLAFAYLGHGIGGYQGGLFFDLTDTYTLSFANAAFAGVINLLIVGALFAALRRSIPVGSRAISGTRTSQG